MSADNSRTMAEEVPEPEWDLVTAPKWAVYQVDFMRKVWHDEQCATITKQRIQLEFKKLALGSIEGWDVVAAMEKQAQLQRIGLGPEEQALVNMVRQEKQQGAAPRGGGPGRGKKSGTSSKRGFSAQGARF